MVVDRNVSLLLATSACIEFESEGKTITHGVLLLSVRRCTVSSPRFARAIIM
jgi:hypothetical protein